MEELEKEYDGFSFDSRYLNFDNRPLEINGIDDDEIIKIDDIVKIKGVDYTVIVKYIDYKIDGIGTVDFAGVKNLNDEDLVLFNRYNIEKKINNGKTKK